VEASAAARDNRDRNFQLASYQINIQKQELAANEKRINSSRRISKDLKIC